MLHKPTQNKENHQEKPNVMYLNNLINTIAIIIIINNPLQTANFTSPGTQSETSAHRHRAL